VTEVEFRTTRWISLVRGLGPVDACLKFSQSVVPYVIFFLRLQLCSIWVAESSLPILFNVFSLFASEY
jgi:hypothetical protein